VREREGGGWGGGEGGRGQGAGGQTQGPGTPQAALQHSSRVGFVSQESLVGCPRDPVEQCSHSSGVQRRLLDLRLWCTAPALVMMLLWLVSDINNVTSAGAVHLGGAPAPGDQHPGINPLPAAVVITPPDHHPPTLQLPLSPLTPPPLLPALCHTPLPPPDGAPVVPISAQLRYNVDVVCEYIEKRIPVPVRDFVSPPHLIVIRWVGGRGRSVCLGVVTAAWEGAGAFTLPSTPLDMGAPDNMPLRFLSCPCHPTTCMNHGHASSCSPAPHLLLQVV
jgi:hypothetical protein